MQIEIFSKSHFEYFEYLNVHIHSIFKTVTTIFVFIFGCFWIVFSFLTTVCLVVSYCFFEPNGTREVSKKNFLITKGKSYFEMEAAFHDEKSNASHSIYQENTT